MESQNVTMRRKKTVANDSFNLSFISSHSDYLSKSLPDLSSGNMNDEEIKELKEEIKKIREQLDAAHSEIESLTLENNTLKISSSEMETMIKKLKLICTESTDSSKKHIHASTKRKRASKIKLSQDTKLNTSCIDLGLKHDENGIDGATEPLLNITTTPASIAASRSECSDNVGKKCNADKPTDGAVLSSLPCTLPSTHGGSVNYQQPINITKNTKELPKILIVGGQQCTGLASELIHSRHNTSYGKYHTSSIMKPYAKSEEILKACYEFEDSIDNYIIMCLGENDTNPYQLMIDLSYALRSIQNTNIIILNVRRNIHLNETMLNNTIKNISKHFSNCSYLDIPINYANCTKKQYLLQTCDKINSIIDTQYYKKTFLTLNQNKSNPSSQCNQSCKCILQTSKVKKGTIPYYFPIKKTLESASNTRSGESSSRFFRE